MLKSNKGDVAPPDGVPIYGEANNLAVKNIDCAVKIKDKRGEFQLKL